MTPTEIVISCLKSRVQILKDVLVALPNKKDAKAKLKETKKVLDGFESGEYQVYEKEPEQQYQPPNRDNW